MANGMPPADSVGVCNARFADRAARGRETSPCKAPVPKASPGRHPVVS
jgi:hypothetical protein